MDYISIIEQHLHKKINGLYTIVSKGWDYEVIICDGKIFRFPKNKEKLLDIQLEKQKLETIDPYITLEIPKYTIVDDSFIVYPLILGKTFDDVINGYSEEVIGDIAHFLRQLHSIPLDKFEFLSKPKEPTQEEKKGFEGFVSGMKDKIEQRLTNKVPGQTIIDIKNYMDELFFVYESPKKAFVHTDLQGKNMIYNEQSKRLSGIIDFTDSRVGGIELDFCHFRDVGNGVLERILELYNGNTDSSILDRIFFLARRGVLFEITNDDIYYNKFDYILEQLKKFRFL